MASTTEIGPINGVGYGSCSHITGGEHTVNITNIREQNIYKEQIFILENVKELPPNSGLALSEEFMQEVLGPVKDELSALKHRVEHLEDDTKNRSSLPDPPRDHNAQNMERVHSLERPDGNSKPLTQLCDEFNALLVDIPSSKRETITKSVNSLRSSGPLAASQVKKTLVSAARALKSTRLPPIYHVSIGRFNECSKELLGDRKKAMEHTDARIRTTIRTPNFDGLHLRLTQASFPPLYGIEEIHPAELTLTIAFVGGHEIECKDILKKWSMKNLGHKLLFKGDSAEILGCCVSEPVSYTLCGVRITFTILKDQKAYSRFLARHKNESIYVVLCFKIADQDTIEKICNQVCDQEIIFILSNPTATDSTL